MTDDGGPPRGLDEQVARRIGSEREYHETFYKRTERPLRVSFDLATRVERKPHNLTWAYYDTIRDHFHGDLKGKRMLVIGCGWGVTALNLAKCGARVDAFDLSPEAIEICKRRAEHNEVSGVNFFVSSCEELELPEGTYDAVVGEMILHHIDIPIAMEKCHRLLRDGGLGVFMEWKVYALVDRVRAFPLLRRLFPPGGVQKYATEYERKLTREDFEVIRRRFPDMRLDIRYCMCGKIDYFSPDLGNRIEPLDWLLLRKLPFLRPFTDGAIIQFTKAS